MTSLHEAYPDLSLIPDTSRGEQRFAAEVILADSRLETVPQWAFKRALRTLNLMANEVGK